MKSSLQDGAERRKYLSKVIKLHKPAGQIKVTHNDALVDNYFDSAKNNNGNGGKEPGNAAGLIPLEDIADRAEYKSSKEDLDAAYRRGYEEGRTETIEELKKDFQLQLKQEHQVIRKLTESIAEQFRYFHQKSEQFVVKFAIAIAERIIKREVQTDREVILRLIREAIHKVMGVERITIHLNPDDEEIVQHHRGELLSRLGRDSVREILIEPDEKIERGGCVIESNQGNVDARISEQIRKLESEFLAKV